MATQLYIEVQVLLSGVFPPWIAAAWKWFTGEHNQTPGVSEQSRADTYHWDMEDIASREPPPETDYWNRTGGRSDGGGSQQHSHSLQQCMRYKKYIKLLSISLRNLCLEWNKACWQRNLIMVGSGGSRQGLNSGWFAGTGPYCCFLIHGRGQTMCTFPQLECTHSQNPTFIRKWADKQETNPTRQMDGPLGGMMKFWKLHFYRGQLLWQVHIPKHNPLQKEYFSIIGAKYADNDALSNK